MRIAYLILAHDHPSQLKSLTTSLQYLDDHIFVHVNKKSNLRLFHETDQQPHVSLIPQRIAVHWGGFSMVQATLNLLHAARAHPHPFDYYCFLSGSDYPLRSNPYIHSYFEDRKSCEFINLVDAYHDDKVHLLSRLQYLSVEQGLTRDRFLNFLLFQLNDKILRSKRLKRNYQKHLGNLKPYIGDAWWALSDPAITYMLQFIDRHPKFLNFYRYAPHPLEMLFHTIIGNSPFMEQASDNVTYSHWSPDADSPSFITETHLDELETQQQQGDLIPDQPEFLFARKFPSNRPDLIARVEAHLRSDPIKAQ